MLDDFGDTVLNTADLIEIETDEDGFHLIVETVGGDRYDFRIQGVAEDLHRQAQDAIGPWLVEKWETKARIDALEAEYGDEDDDDGLSDPDAYLEHVIKPRQNRLAADGLHHTPEIWEG